ncbi:hypothetical protein RHMOL_Rhmol06G0245200 [Rhododendron molle]|uniref:Uncharacterized protein n=1 Tax=Rhododendron molle TaxID=49168 RepID=A0ACC0NH96_RHOML|nr:hypothetical protein RHMOL_Rhmol06G0245200 [Rhododendron molle]
MTVRREIKKRGREKRRGSGAAPPVVVVAARIGGEVASPVTSGVFGKRRVLNAGKSPFSCSARRGVVVVGAVEEEEEERGCCFREIRDGDECGNVGDGDEPG